MGIEIDLNGKCVLITGAAGRIGSEISRNLALAGADLILLDTAYQAENLHKLCNSLKEEYGAVCETVICNITEINNQILTKEIEKRNHIDVLVNNAGVNVIKPAISITEEEWDRVLDVNLKAAFFLSQQVARKAIKSGTGLSIINIASQHGVVGNQKRAPYCSSKGGLILLTKALAVEWAKYQIRVNSISPSFVISENNYEVLMSTQSKREYLQNIPMGKYCKPQDVANAVLYLASSLSEYMTGENVLIDGGYTAK